MKNCFRTFLFSIGALSLVLLIARCTSSKDDSSRLQWDTISVSPQIALLEGANSPKLSVDVSYIYPTNDDSLYRLFNRLMFSDSLYKHTATEAVNRFVSLLGKEYRETNADFVGESTSSLLGDFSYSQYNDIDYEDSDILACEKQTLSYEGGVRPENQIQHFNIDLKNRRLISESDLFVEGYKDPLSKILIAQLMNEFSAKEAKDLISEGFVNPEEILPNNNFYIDNEGITYCFNEYEIMGHSNGPVYISVPYTSLLSILKDNAIVRKFIE